MNDFNKQLLEKDKIKLYVSKANISLKIHAISCQNEIFGANEALLENVQKLERLIGVHIVLADYLIEKEKE